MYTLSGDSVNEVCLNAFKLLKERGVSTTTDKGEVLEVRRVLSELHNPRNRYLYLDGRNNSIYAAIAETFWVMTGSTTVDGWLERFIHRAKLYSDDGHSWYRGYGKMLYQNNQLGGVLDYLTNSLATRQAVLSIYDPSAESYDSVINAIGNINAKDKSCNNLLYFSTDSTRTKLDLHVCNRSNDVLFGAYSINAFEFTFLQEVVASMLNLDVGIYSTYHNNLHAYFSNQSDGSQFNKVLELDQTKNIDYTTPSTYLGLGLTNIHGADNRIKVLSLRKMFTEIISSLQASEGLVFNTLSSWCINPGTKIYNYCVLLNAYLYPDVQVDISSMDLSLQKAILHSKFTKFKVI